MSFPVGPDDTPWYPRANGNYLDWRVRFNDKIQTFCSRNNAFENGVSVFPSNALKSLFNTFVSQSSVDDFTRVLEHGKLGDYLLGKQVYIAFFIIALIYCIVLGVLTKCLCNKNRKVGGACVDKLGQRPQQSEGERKLRFLVMSVVGLFSMFALAIACFIFSSSLFYGAKSLNCDFWMAMKGHYFGTANIQAPSDVALDWKGSQVQYKAMSHLQQMVNPKPANLNETCLLCQHIEEKFSGKGGLVEVLSISRDRVMNASKSGALLAEAFHAAAVNLRLPPKYLDSAPIRFEMQDRNRNVYPSSAAATGALLVKYAMQLNETTNEGVELLRTDMRRFLGRDSIMLQASLETANTSVTSLGDVDFVMAKSIVIWEHKVEPMMHRFMTVTLVMTFALGFGAMCFFFEGLIVFRKLINHTNNGSLPSTKITSIMRITSLILLLFSGFTFLISSILFFVASSGNDACQFTDKVIYEEGRWSVFADVLLKTISEHTNIPTVLDTCVKETGDGDVAAALGIKILLDKLAQSVATTKVDLQNLVERKLDLEFKNLKTNALVDMVQMMVSLITVNRVEVTIPYKYGSDNRSRIEPVPNGLDWISYAREPAQTTYFQPLNLVVNNIDAQLESIRSLALDGIFLSVHGCQQAFDWVNSLIKIANDPQIKGICSSHLRSYQLCVEKSGVYMLNKGLIDNEKGASFGSSEHKGALNPWTDEPFLNLFQRIADSTPIMQRPNVSVNEHWKLNHHPVFPQTVHAFAQVIWSLTFFDVASSTLLIDLKAKYKSIVMKRQDVRELLFEEHEKFEKELEEEKKEAELLGEEFFIKTFSLTPFVVIKKFLGDIIVCVDPKDQTKQITPKTDTEWATCTFADVVPVWKLYNQKLAETLIAGFKVGSGEILKFVNDVAVGSFEALLAKAEDDLADFNGQFVGTSIRQGVVAGVCGVIMPSVAALGLTAIFLSMFSGVGAWVTWKVYHSSHVCGYCDLKNERSSGLIEKENRFSKIQTEHSCSTEELSGFIEEQGGSKTAQGARTEEVGSKTEEGDFKTE